MLSRRSIVSLGGLAGLTCLTGCALPSRTTGVDTPTEAVWTGRLALQVEGRAEQSFTAAFDLRGNAMRGQLTLQSPFGSTLARLEWDKSGAHLTTPEESRWSESIEDLLRQVTGSSIPLDAIFSWLQGYEASAEGWQADLSAIHAGRLMASRQTPAPVTTLRIALTR